MTDRQVFIGGGGLRNYLTPKKNKYIPLVELPGELNPYLKSHNIHLSAKLMNTLPLMNVKSIPAHGLISSVNARNKTIVESSSGNTVFSMGILAKYFGAKDVMAIASPEVSSDKLNLLRLANIKVRLVDGPICPDANDPDSSISVARRLGQRSDWCNPGQYDNDANPLSHENITGPQLYDQLGDKLGMFVAGLGTTGSLVGVSRYLKSRLFDIKTSGVMRAPNNKVPGVRTKNGLKEVEYSWGEQLTEPPVVVDEYDSYEASLQLIRAGLLVGPSSGFAYKGAMMAIERLISEGRSSELYGKHVVFICPDSCFAYIDEYFEVLGGKLFPEIDDQSSLGRHNVDSSANGVPLVSVDELYSNIVNGSGGGYQLIDVREQSEFEDHHIKGSLRVDFMDMPSWLKSEASPGNRYLFICSRSARSLRAADMTIKAGFEAFVLDGGTSRWSSKGYDRERPKQCDTAPISSN
ncbi:pyridoxal-phosphate dependent enzyme [Candidatus Saccharibacteria bacterium]|jgi:cysteine synthase/rhodanese-related sulfurtransferase|nr:pyridoxal-phosphate dependent enzyme [Candidatus Saccharibacteria bacterium]